MNSKKISAKTLTSENAGRGFHGEMEIKYGSEEADALFTVAAQAMIDQLGISAERAIEYLDSGLGRHFGDRVIDMAAESEAAKNNPELAVLRAVEKRPARVWNHELAKAGI